MQRENPEVFLLVSKIKQLVSEMEETEEKESDLGERLLHLTVE